MEPRSGKLSGRFRTGAGACHQRGPRGAALLIVLSMLVLLSILVVAFLSNVNTDLSSSQNYATGTTVERLAESTVQMVAAQIMEGTQSRSGTAPITWASQPGLIRSYRSDGTPGQFYKLYSSGALKVPGTSFSVNAEMPPVDWNANAKTGLYTDLNSPVASGSDVIFPIVDPRAKTASAGSSVQGFNYDAGKVNGAVAPGASADSQRLPMPVQWLYQLQDGTLLAPDLSASSNGAVAFSGAKSPTAANPIVGRVAFWTDDESTKVNINTAAFGVYWDVPFYMSDYEYIDMSLRPPPGGEFQRYPGHPFTTSLDPVLRPWLPVAFPVTADNYGQLQAYYRLNPRTNPDDGTRGGTVNTNVKTDGSVAKVVPKSDRLYSTVDELLFTPVTSGTSRTANSGVSPDILRKVQFFLTASSRAPDVNLFGRPRVSLWPVSVNTAITHRTPEDRLIAFCTSVGRDNSGNLLPYYFQRQSPDGISTDFSIPRNQVLFRYLQGELAAAIPGFGGNFVSKWNTLTGGNGIAERDEFLTLVFDYIRGSTNLCDPKLNPKLAGTPAGAVPYTQPYGLFGSVADGTKRYPGFTVPTMASAPDTGTPVKGVGRFPVIEQFLLIFYAVPVPVGTGADTATTVQAYVVPVFHDANLGMMNSRGMFRVKAKVVSGDFTALATPASAGGTATGGGPLDFFGGNEVMTWANQSARSGLNGRTWGGNYDSSPVTLVKKFGQDSSPSSTSYGLYAFNKPVLTGNPADTHATWDFKGGTMKFEIRTYDDVLIQTYTIDFPDVSKLAIPSAFTVAADAPVPPNGGFIDFAPNGKWGRSEAVYNYAALFMGANNTQGDIVRAVQLRNGDFRLLSTLRDVPASYFKPVPNNTDYADGSKRRLHNRRDGHGTSYRGASHSGLLVPSAKMAAPPDSSLYPFIHSSINGVFINDDPANAPGDWNTGFGLRPDGSYLNKPDEGAAMTPANGGNAYFDYDAFEQAPNLSSPNRQMPSAVMLGSLPLGTKAVPPISWLTPLFHPDYEALGGGKTHPGSTSPKDYLLLDLFTMPVVEPYAISEPLSTAGRINMNYQIIPFSYIQRDTGVRAVLASERLPMISNTYATYKNSASTAVQKSAPANQRPFVNIDETLKGFENRFAAGDIFRSPAEVCDLYMVPMFSDGATSTYNNMPALWKSYLRTGDNLKERPYLTIYPRLTTKSNTYTVHLRVQSLKKVSGSPVDRWVESHDKVAAEYRGSAMIERYVDPSDPALPDFAADASATLDGFYRFRVVNTKRFSP